MWRFWCTVFHLLVIRGAYNMAYPPSSLRRPADLTHGVFGISLPVLILSGYACQAFYCRDLLAVERSEQKHVLKVKSSCCLVSKTCQASATPSNQFPSSSVQYVLDTQSSRCFKCRSFRLALSVWRISSCTFRIAVSVSFYPRRSTRSVHFCTLQSQWFCLRRQHLQ